MSALIRLTSAKMVDLPWILKVLKFQSRWKLESGLLIYLICLFSLLCLIVFYQLVRLLKYLLLCISRFYWLTVAWLPEVTDRLGIFAAIRWILLYFCRFHFPTVVTMAFIVITNNIVVYHGHSGSRVAKAKTIGMLALLNSLPLFAGGKVRLILKLLNLNKRTYYQVHGCFGVTVLVQSCVHTYQSYSKIKNPPATAVIAFTAICLAVSVCIVPHFFSAFKIFAANIHLIFSLLYLVLIYFHVKTMPVYKIACLATGGLYLGGILLRMIDILRTNISFSGMTRIEIQKVGDSQQDVRLFISVPHKWRGNGAQEVHLWIPTLGLQEIFQLQVVSVGQFTNHAIGSRLQLVLSGADGFGKRLQKKAQTSGSIIRGFLEGPYSSMGQHDPAKFCYIVMFAEDAYAVQQFSNLIFILDNSRKMGMPTREIQVVWCFTDGMVIY